MRPKREGRPAIPARVFRYVPAQWDSPGQWIAEREKWNAAQPKILLAGTDAYGVPWSYLAGPLGDRTDLFRARREARLIAFADVDSG